MLGLRVSVLTAARKPRRHNTGVVVLRLAVHGVAGHCVDRRCITAQLLHCKPQDGRCNETLASAVELESEFWERAFMELKNPITDGPQVLKKHPWDKLKRVVRDAFVASRRCLATSCGARGCWRC